MPYIPQADRDRIDKAVMEAIELVPNMEIGELTYFLFKCIRMWVKPRERYYAYASVIGAIEATKAEFIRRDYAEYEDRKLAENGDVEV